VHSGEPRRSPAAVNLFVCLAAFVLGLPGCVLRPQWQQLALDADLKVDWIRSHRFRHLLLTNDVDGGHLRIYVEGDGVPWKRQTRISVDPTPSNPLLLRLMHNATHPAAYLGRPCYFGAATDPGCGPRWWTSDRYSAPVIASMCEAANTVIRKAGAETVQLIGYSGGGAIVVGMRRCTDKLVAVSTLAANLDPVRWTTHHGYAPVHSEAPPDLFHGDRDGIREVHWQCRDDRNIPPNITDGYFERNPWARRELIDDCSHVSSWERYWSQILE
jgi:pimeloyl-ACP methyl ester carboxylesterase